MIAPGKTNLALVQKVKTCVLLMCIYCCRAGRRLRAQPLGGAVGSTLPNTRNLDRTFRKTPEGTGPLQDRESSINQPRETGLSAKLQNTERPTWRATEDSHPRRHSYGTSRMRARPVRNPSGWLPRSRRSKCTQLWQQRPF